MMCPLGEIKPGQMEQRGVARPVADANQEDFLNRQERRVSGHAD